MNLNCLIRDHDWLPTKARHVWRGGAQFEAWAEQSCAHCGKTRLVEGPVLVGGAS